MHLEKAPNARTNHSQQRQASPFQALCGGHTQVGGAGSRAAAGGGHARQSGRGEGVALPGRHWQGPDVKLQ